MQEASQTISPVALLLCYLVTFAGASTYSCPSRQANGSNQLKPKIFEADTLDHVERLVVQVDNDDLPASYLKFRSYLRESGENSDHFWSHDNSTDRRLANMVELVRKSKAYDLEFDEFNSGNQQEDANNEQLVAGPKVDDTLCGQHLDQMLKLMNEMQQINNGNQSVRYQDRHLRMARLLDSFGHYESGYLSGRKNSFGSYDQCRSTRLELMSEASKQDELTPELTKTRFCWARLSVDDHLDPKLRQENLNEHQENFLRVAVCLPETCHSRSLQMYRTQLEELIYSQFKLASPLYVQPEPKLASIFCTVDHNSNLAIPTNGKVLLILLLAWFCLLAFATLYRKQRESSDTSGENAGLMDDILECLDVRSSWLDLIGSECNHKDTCLAPRRVELDTLNPIRWAGCAFVIYGHVLLNRTTYTEDTITFPNRMDTELFGTFVLIGTVFVDTFFVISGVLLTFIIMKKANRPREPKPAAEKQRPPSPVALQLVSSVYQIVKARYLRLAPLLLLVYWFKRSVFTYLGSGPMWDFGFNKDTLYGGCQHESWLVPVSFGSAFLPLSRQCLLQSWSVSNDMFFVVLLAPVILIMTKKPKLAGLMMLMLCLVSNFWTLNDLVKLELTDVSALRELMVYGVGPVMNRLSFIYTFPIYRVSSYIIGCLAGYLLFLYDTNEKIMQWPGWFRGTATKLAFVYLFAQFCILSNANLLKPLMQPHYRLLFPYSMTLGKVLWASSNAIIFLRMATDWNGNYWMRLSAGPFWQTISKLCYAMLLVHLDVAIYDGLISPQASLTNYWTIYQSFSSVYLASTVLSAFLYVTVEIPMHKLTKRL